MTTRMNRIALAVPLIASLCLAAPAGFAAPAGPQAVLEQSAATPQRPGIANVQGEDVQATIAVSPASAAPGKRLGVTVNIRIAPGWHIYGQPLPENYVPTTLRFDKALLASQSIELPKATPVNFKGLGETLPVYQGDVKASGTIVLKDELKPGNYRIGGEFRYQECNNLICKMPQALKFELPVTVAAAH
jgi:DsbC/DsbD-like thiol-disulfide interchange protein